MRNRLLVLPLMRQWFRVARLETSIRFAVYDCKICAIYRINTGLQTMAALTRSFTDTGLELDL